MYNQTSLQDYSSQLTSSSPDYNIYTDEDNLAYIQRTSSSTIGETETVLVDYEHLENIVISYSTNLVLSTLQAKIDEEKHMGADVLVKEISAAPVDVKALVYIEKGSNPANIDALVRSNLIIRIEAEGRGGRIYSSDLIKEIDSVVGVSHVNVPLSQVSLSPDTLILRGEGFNNSTYGYLRDHLLKPPSVVLRYSSEAHSCDSGRRRSLGFSLTKKSSVFSMRASVKM